MPPRFILGIETSNPSAWTPDQPSRPGVALARADADTLTHLGMEEIDPSVAHDAGLIPAIDRLLRRAGIRPRDLTRIAVSIGPGGYTAVRVAVTTAKFIAEAGGAQCIPVPSALVVAARAPHAGAPFAVALGSKDGTTFLTRFDAASRPMNTGCLISATDLPADLPLLIADRFLPDEVRARATALGIAIHPPFFDPLACIEAALALDAVDPAHLVPFYPREPEAVTKWRERKAARP